MPSRPPRVCNRCRNTYTGTRCPCRPAWEGSSWTNGGDRRWRKIRNDHIADNPICQRPGCTRLATQVDHITNVAAGGAKYDRSNVQSLCDPHHAEKTASEAAAGRHRPR